MSLPAISHRHPSSARKRRWSLAAGVLVVAGLVVGLASHVAHASGSAVFSLSPASGSHDNSTNFTVSVYENSGGVGINAVEMDLTYDASKLQYVSVDTSSGPFDLVIPNQEGGGSVKISEAFSRKPDGTNSLTGSQLVGTITFKALVGSGSTSPTFASTSRIIETDNTADVWNHAAAAGTYSFTTPTSPSPSPSPTPSPSPSPHPGSPTPSPTPGTPAPSPSPSSPGSTSTPTSTSTNTYLVAVKVVDGNDKPVQGADVTLGNQSTTTTAGGIASFSKVAPGNTTVTVDYKGHKTSQSLVVTDSNQPITPQQVQIKLAGVSRNYQSFVIGLILVLLALGGGGLWFMRWRLDRPLLGRTNGGEAPSGPAASVTTTPTTSAPATGSGKVFYPESKPSTVDKPPTGGAGTPPSA